jgi:hypothetical protein
MVFEELIGHGRIVGRGARLCARLMTFNDRAIHQGARPCAPTGDAAMPGYFFNHHQPTYRE